MKKLKIGPKIFYAGSCHAWPIAQEGYFFQGCKNLKILEKSKNRVITLKLSQLPSLFQKTYQKSLKTLKKNYFNGIEHIIFDLFDDLGNFHDASF